MPRYFSGKLVSTKRLDATTATTFADLISHYVNLTTLLPVTSAEYHSLPSKHAKDDVKRQLGYLVACTFPESPWLGGRSKEHAGECNLIFLDIDNSSHAKLFVERPEALREKLGAFNFAAYKTTSSTPDAPRLRVMVDASAIPVERYADAVLTVAQLLGLPEVTRESAVPVQPMFRPAMFADQETEDHPLIITHFTGRAFGEGDIMDDIDSLPGMVSAKKPSVRKRTGDTVDDFLLFFQQPVPQVTLDIAEEALSFIDPDCGYHEWLEIAAAMKHQFGGEHEHEAYLLFDSWSARGSKYAGQKDTTAKWKSLVQHPTGRMPVTIRSLLKRAAEAGWDTGEVKESCFQDVSRWINFDAKSATELMAEGVKRIAATPLISITEEDALLQMLVSAARQRFEFKLTVTALRRDLKKHRESLHVAKDAEKPEVVVPPWARGVVYVASTNTMVRHATRQTFTLEAFDNVYSRKLLPSVEELQKADIPVTQASLNTPMFKPSSYLLNHIKCQTVDDLDYDPASPQDTIVKRDGKLFLNVYRRSYREADKKFANYAEDILCEHLCNLIKEPEYITVMLDWMAYCVQHPGSKIRWAVLMQGAEGCGKTWVARVMQTVLGDDNFRLINKESIKRGWNEWTFGAQLVAIEEIRVAGHNRHDIMNTLKEPITNDYITVNERARNTRTARNVTNYIAFTNHHDALALSDESRRWFVLKSIMQTREQIAALVDRMPDYFVRIFDMLATHGQGLRWILENRTISDAFNANGPAPRTTYLSEMIHDTSNELLAVIHQIWEEEENVLVRPDIICATSLAHELEMRSVRATPQYVASVLREAGFSRLEGRHTIGGGERQYVWLRSDKHFEENPLAILEERLKVKINTGDDFWH